MTHDEPGANDTGMDDFGTAGAGPRTTSTTSAASSTTSTGPGSGLRMGRGRMGAIQEDRPMVLLSSGERPINTGVFTTREEANVEKGSTMLAP